MATYRLFPIDRSGHVLAPAFEVDCDCDQAAIDEAQRLLSNRDGFDIWIGDRRVQTVLSSSINQRANPP
jgi:hypothetical protein